MVKKFWKGVLVALSAIIILLAVFVFSAVIRFKIRYEVNICQQYSMVPTLNLSIYLDGYVYTSSSSNTAVQPGDYVILDTKSTEFEVGDIVSAIVNWDTNNDGVLEEEHIVKRLIGTPSDWIKIVETELEDGSIQYDLYVNGEILYSKAQYEFVGYSTITGEAMYLDNTYTYKNYLAYLKYYEGTSSVQTDENGDKCIVLGEDEYLIIGDNWQSSYDCFDALAPVSSADLEYKVVGVIEYGKNYNWNVIIYAIKLWIS